MGNTIKERTLEFIKSKNISVKELSVSNKTAPKVYKNAPILGRGKVKINYLILAVAATGCKGR